MAQVYCKKAVGSSLGHFELQIDLASSKVPDRMLYGPDMDPIISDAIYKAAELIEAAVMEVGIRGCAESQRFAKTQRQEILGLFDAPIYVETIPNGYCNEACCKHLPWFKITTSIGRFKVGWRKHVMHIDWLETVAKKTAEALFPDDPTTKDGRMIHAQSWEDARRYIKTVIESVKNNE